MKKNIKKISPTSFDDIKIIGINSSLADFKLAWNINNKLSINFVRYNDIFENGAQYAFYYYDTGETGNTFNLVSLVYKGTYWQQTSPRIDFMLIIRNYIAPTKLNEMLKSIREIPGIGYAFIMDPLSDNSIGLLLETIELHEIDLLNEMQKRNNIKAVKEEMRKKKLNQPLQ